MGQDFAVGSRRVIDPDAKTLTSGFDGDSLNPLDSESGMGSVPFSVLQRATAINVIYGGNIPEPGNATAKAPRTTTSKVDKIEGFGSQFASHGEDSSQEGGRQRHQNRLILRVIEAMKRLFQAHRSLSAGLGESHHSGVLDSDPKSQRINYSL